MSESKFESALVALQCTADSSAVLKVLIAVRKGVEWPVNKDNITKLREKGCLKQIVAYLQNGQKNVIDICLSILGNCLMDKGCSRDVVVQFNILSVLNQLLKKFPKEDSINGRTFRIIGNMCQHRDQWANIILDRKPHIVSHVVDFIKKASKDELPKDEKISDASILMGLKSLRELLNCQTVMALVKNFGVLKAVGSLFIKYSLEWQQTKKHEKLLTDIIRLLQEYSRYKYYHSIIEMRNTDRGDSLIHLSNVLILAPRRIVKIVMNFIRISQLKSELPIPEICDRFIEVLKNHSIIKELDGECIEYLQCLCYLLEHPANRNTERCGKCIPLLINVLDEFHQPTNNVLECCLLLIATLNKCKYDDNLMFGQLQRGIIKVLIEKLRWLVGDSKKLNVKHADEKKRKYKFAQSPPECSKRYGMRYDELKQPQSPSSSDEEIDVLLYMKFNRSPSPCSSDNSDNVFSWSSPGSSPSRSVANDNVESDSDDYSPVCSEADNKDFPLTLPQQEEEEDEVSFMDHEGVVEMTETDLEIEEEHSTNKNVSLSLKIGLLTEVAKLLKTYIKLKPCAPQLASEELLMVLLKCSGNFEWNFSSNIDTVDVICRILDTHDYLLPLMQTEFIETVYNLTEIQHGQWCTKCSTYQLIGNTILKKFTFLAESGVGKGEIAHKLLRGDTNLKQQLVLTIPYIVKNKAVLGKLMLNCGGLEILMELLRDNDAFKRRSIKVLCAMATRKLAIANPKQSSSTVSVGGLNRPKLVADKYKLCETCDNVVTFKLDDGNSLKANRDFLVEKSDYFNGLLNGYFKESKEDEISLQNVKLKSLRCLLFLLENVDKAETVEIDLELETLLDVIVLSDRYLMVDLCLSLTDSVEQFNISAETVPVIYRWSLESGTNLLRVEAIAFALVANMDESERVCMFESLFSLGYSEQLVGDIQRLLMRYLTANQATGKQKDWSLKRKQMTMGDCRMKDKLLKSNA